MRCKRALYLAGLAGLVFLLAAPAPFLVWGQADKDTKDKEAAPATLIVRLPDASAKLEIAGTSTISTGEERRFVSPPLAPGKEFTYAVKATWEPNNYTKITRKANVLVRAGKESVVDLR